MALISMRQLLDHAAENDYGVPAFNVNNLEQMRLASTAPIREFLANNKAEFDPRKYLSASLKAMKEVVIERYEAFGTAGNASKLKVNSLEVMFAHYANGDLAPVVT